MIDARLQVALNAGGLELPDEGRIAVFRPPVDADLSGFVPDRCDMLHDFKPFYDAWANRGYDARYSPDGPYAAAIVCLPRAKAEARHLIAQACEVTDGPVIIDGQKTDGVDSILKEMKRRVTVQGPISKAHGKMFWIDATATEFFADWIRTPERTEGGFWTAPGVFSADGVDLASALLVEALPEKMSGHVADLGAGWGFLAAHVLTRSDVTQMHLVEAGHLALECAKRNVTDERARHYWQDAVEWAPDHKMDAIVMNPPFHTGRAAEPQIGQAFVAAAARLLSSHGDLWMVANRHLPYETELKKRFSQVSELGGDARFKLFHATRPVRARRRG
ncbi:Ribosomal RNA small subunit methyltransferase C [Sulfitobacter noctilucicola]|uniref:16S rRNA (Guanine1207-N2)-methyltransferase n=1 Tax=Sulfitobacter noctilucicola TaxID=1342301 RepID=A0A7W6M5Y2_9RHOB|nr:class I SAM-dependent methyltransferase [Sulfitobacter noctilucicola]KIN62384.1 Ribosomal RNA small subunit methyltransferase C [Sulfitobacter noctilucicola]MBB4173083.1 16S rRNA (guanine1207-N2)-methyltransferase [Sulfitobacter noctilucicola]